MYSCVRCVNFLNSNPCHVKISTWANASDYSWRITLSMASTYCGPMHATPTSLSLRSKRFQSSYARNLEREHFFFLSFQFSRRTRVEPLATQANQPWWSYIFQHTWQVTRVYNEKMMLYRAKADSFLVILGDFGCDFDWFRSPVNELALSRSVPSSSAHSNSASSPRDEAEAMGG